MTELPESTYHYHIAKKTKTHKDKELEDLIQAIFEEHKERYGYRRITIELRARGYKVNHKRVLRIMRQLGLQCLKFTNRSRRYNSYKGPVGKVAKNKINLRFMTPHPLQKLVTDITEFKCLNDEKLYLSPIMDLYNQALVLHKTENHCYLFIVN